MKEEILSKIKEQEKIIDNYKERFEEQLRLKNRDEAKEILDEWTQASLDLDVMEDIYRELRENGQIQSHH